MRKILIGAIALALAMPVATAIAQTTSGQNNGNVTLPHGNSGAGVNGMQGNKSGPAPKASSTTGASVDSGGRTGAQDAAKVPGKAGGKAGPAVKPQSDSASGSK